MNPHRISRLVAVAGLLAAHSSVFAQSSAQPDAAAWAPADAFFVLAVGDVNGFWEDFKKTQEYAAFQDPAAREVGGENSAVYQATEEFQKRLAEFLGTSPDQMKNPFAGSLSFFVGSPRGGSEDDHPMALTIGVGDRDLMRTYYDAVIKRLKERADRHEGVSAGSNTIDVFTTTPRSEEDTEDESDEEPDFDEAAPSGLQGELIKAIEELFALKEMPEEVALCYAEDRLIVGDNAETVRSVLRRSESDSAASMDDWKSIKRHFKEPGKLRFLVNVPRMVEQARREASEDDRKMMAAMGFDGLRSIIGHVQLAGDGFDSKTEVLAITEGQRTGLIKLLSPPNRRTLPDPAVPAEAILFGSVNFDPPTLVDDILRIVRQIDPATADEVHHDMENVPTPSGEMMNLRKDLIDHLRGPGAFTLSFTQPYGVDSGRALLTVHHANMAAVQKAVGIVPLVTQRDYQGSMVYDGPGNVSIGVANDRVLTGTTAAVERSLQSASGEKLSDSPLFTSLARHAPAESWFTFFADDRRLFQAAVGLVEHRQALQMNMFANFTAAIAYGVVEFYASDVDPSKVDALRKLEKYHGGTLITVDTAPDGLRITAVTVRAP